MIDLNTLISNALTAAVQQAVAPLNERIAKLEFCNAERHQRLLVLEGALTDRVVALETKLTEANLFTQMVPTPSVLAAQYTPISNEQIKAALQEWATKDSLLEHLDNQEWFWEKLQNRIDAATESAIDAHCETYDHDSYENAVSDLEDRDFVTNDSLEDAVREAVGNLSFDISVS